MKAIICDKPGSLSIRDLAEPQLRSGEVMLQIQQVGICGTDLHAYAGNQPFFSYPRILGHELSAKVIEIHKEAKTDLIAGDLVVVIPYIHCGQCFACRNGKTNCCKTLSVYGVHQDGGMREFFSYPPELLLKAPGLSAPEMAIVEPLCIGTHAVERAGIHPSDWVVVSGCGPIGVGILWAAKAKSNNLIALDIDQHRLEFCKNNLGIKHTLTVDEELLPKLQEITGGDMAQIVFDATGIKGPMEKSINYLSSGGQYVLVGLNRGDLTFNHPSMHARELSILCSRNATRLDFDRVIHRMQNQEFNSKAYISHSEPYDQIPHRMDDWKDPKNQVMKVVTDWTS
ncbi:MAG: zinc-binding alcohol dehydrogenase family protein [Saprospiraceae bacterium]|nr:zinc-binding alcohol dehydrogenase family protein [Saprospiraceae bacterium]